MRHSSVVLLSGGLDSAANLAFCRERDEPVLALTARYGQRASEREVEAARAFCRYYDVPHEVLDVSWLGGLGKSALTARTEALPELTLQQLEDPSVTQKSVRSVWVPNRNGVLIHIAAAYAESRGAQQVVVGFNREEAVTFPDNSIEYLNRATSALAYSTANQVRVSCYTSDWDKRQIVSELKKLSQKFPFESVWSCYEGFDQPCGKCESCQRLKRALS